MSSPLSVDRRLFTVPIVFATLLATGAQAETRPRYGGTLRVELHDAFELADPPSTGPGLADLSRAFKLSVWEGGNRAVFAADESSVGGRPFLDSVEIQLSRPLRDQSIDLDVGKTDVV
jgi:hypothetical protein